MADDDITQMLGILTTALSVIGFIVEVYLKYGDRSASNNVNYQALRETKKEAFPEATLDGVINCYESFRVHNFNVRKVEYDMRNYKSSKFLVQDYLLKKNCLYLKIQFLDVFDKKVKNNEIKEIRKIINTYFSINFIEPLNNVIIYGQHGYNERIKTAYQGIAKEISTTISA